MWLTLPITGKRHKALQLGLWGDTIVGGWQDPHYAWDNPRGERFRGHLQAEDIEAVIGQALDWLERELGEHQQI